MPNMVRGGTWRIVEAPRLALQYARGKLNILGRSYNYTFNEFKYLQPPARQTARETLQYLIDSPKGFRIRTRDGRSLRVTRIEGDSPLGEGGMRTAFRVLTEDGGFYVARVYDPARTGMSGEAIALALRRGRDLAPPLQEAANDLARSINEDPHRDPNAPRVVVSVDPNLGDEHARAHGVTAQEDYSSASALSRAAEQALADRDLDAAFSGYERLGVDANEQFLRQFVLAHPATRNAVIGEGVPNRPNFRTGYVESAFPDIRRGGVSGTFVNSRYRFWGDGTLEIIAFDAL